MLEYFIAGIIYSDSPDPDRRRGAQALRQVTSGSRNHRTDKTARRPGFYLGCEEGKAAGVGIQQLGLSRNLGGQG
ncbi:hypothetical protein M1N56_03730 [Dehalococcoidia bacterium]|nr:hypothetical protein [Dehalococcoidia bacterium]